MSEEVILEKLRGVESILNQKFTENKDDHIRIEAQVTKTNGRVSTLERWKSYITGAIAILTVLILPILFTVLAFAFDKFLK